MQPTLDWRVLRQSKRQVKLIIKPEIKMREP